MPLLVSFNRGQTRASFKSQEEVRSSVRVFRALLITEMFRKIRTVSPVRLLKSTLLGFRSPEPPRAVKVPVEGNASTLKMNASLDNRKFKLFNTSFFLLGTLITIVCRSILLSKYYRQFDARKRAYFIVNCLIGFRIHINEPHHIILKAEWS